MFDVEAYTRTPVGPTTWPAVDLDDATLVTAACYLAEHLGDTAGWLAHVLVTFTHKQPRITAFLTTWAYERHWLAADMAALSPAFITVSTEPAGRGLYVGPLVEAALANVYGHALTGVQMTERLLDGWVLDVMLTKLLERAPNAAQAQITHVRTALARQQSFFAEEATRALAARRFTRLLTRWRVRHHRFPLHLAGEAHRRAPRVLGDLFGAERAWAHTLDDQIATLPGLRGVHVGTRLLGQVRRQSIMFG